MTIIPLKKKEHEIEYNNKVEVVGTSAEFQEIHYCQMCKYAAKDSIMKYNEDLKEWECWRCGYTINPTLNQTLRGEDQPHVINDPIATKATVIPLKQFSVSKEWKDSETEGGVRPKPKYQSISEAWRSDDDDDDE